MKLGMDCLTSEILFRKAATTNVHSAPKYGLFKAGLSSLIDDWANYKEIVPDMSDFNQNVETTCNSKLRFKKLKDLFIKWP